MYINFQENRVSRSVKIVHTNLFVKNRKLHKFARYNLNFEKSRLADIQYPTADIHAQLEINRSLDFNLQ